MEVVMERLYSERTPGADEKGQKGVCVGGGGEGSFQDQDQDLAIGGKVWTEAL